MSGLLSVVGEGLIFANEYVKTKPSSQSYSNTFPIRINNRGPPRAEEVHFEAIPLDIYSSKESQSKSSFEPTGIPLPQMLIPDMQIEKGTKNNHIIQLTPSQEIISSIASFNDFIDIKKEFSDKSQSIESLPLPNNQLIQKTSLYYGKMM